MSWLRRHDNLVLLLLGLVQALFVGLFLCFCATGIWDSPDLRSVGSIPGVFLLIVGASRLSGYLLPGYREG